jgi:four helix bundle protein
MAVLPPAPHADDSQAVIPSHRPSSHFYELDYIPHKLGQGMAMTTTFEALRVWHDARRLTVQIYRITEGSAFAGDRAMRDQIRRAAISIMSNIAEGYERARPKELLRFLSIAKGSAGEVRCQLYAAEDLGYLPPETASMLRQQAAIVSREIAAFARSEEQRMT